MKYVDLALLEFLLYNTKLSPPPYPKAKHFILHPYAMQTVKKMKCLAHQVFC